MLASHGKSKTFKIIESDMQIHLDEVDRWMNIKYDDDGSIGKLKHIATCDGCCYASWLDKIYLLKWVDITEKRGFWESSTIHSRLSYSKREGSRHSEGRFEILKTPKNCNCSTRMLIMSGCQCGGS